MTSTLVKAAGSAVKGAAQIFPAAGKTGESGFQEILNFQTDRRDTQKAVKQDTASFGGQTSLRKTEHVQGESLKTKDTGKAGAEKEAEALQDADLAGEEREEVLEVLGSVSAQFMEQLGQILGLTKEEIQDVLGQLDMEPLQLLNPENLSGFLLAAAGAEDSLSLITNGELYQDYRTAMEQLSALLEQAGKELGLEGEALLALTEDVGSAPGELGIGGESVSVEIKVDEAVLQEEMPEAGEDSTPRSSQGMSEGNAQTDTQLLKQSAGADAQTDEGNGAQTRQEHTGGQNANFLQQEFKLDSLQAQAAQSGESAFIWDVDTQDIMKQIMDYMKIQIKPDVSNLEMQLHPESLGTVHVQVVSKGGAVTAHFITQNETVKAALESQMIQLKESFQEQGVRVEAVEVSVQAHQFERNLEQGRGRQQEQAPSKGRARRINLNEPLDLEDLEQEEALAAEMMTATGSTVDFTA